MKMLYGTFIRYALVASILFLLPLTLSVDRHGEDAFSLRTYITGRAEAGEAPPGVRRIVSVAPNITETIFALGCGDLVIAVTDFCVYPPEAKGLPKIGGFLNPNLERLTALSPDLVIVQGKHEKVDKFCTQRGIPILHVTMDGLSSIYDGILRLGSVLHCKNRAEELCSTIRRELADLRRETAARPGKRVFICLGRSPGSMTGLYTAGGPSFISEILEIAGGENIFGDVTLPYPEASKESLIKRAPEIIIETRPGRHISDGERRRIVSEWDVLRGIPAVSGHRVYLLTEDFLLVPGPRVGKAARCLAETLRRDD